MSANTETTGVDRTGCKAWCGAIPNSEAGQLYSDCDESVFNGGAFAPEWFEDMDPRDDANVRWCSRRCRDASLGPIAAPAAHVERRKGQRWKWERNGIAWVCELISGSGYAWNAQGRDGYRGEGYLIESDWTGSFGATMTLLADAPPELAPFGSAAFVDAVISSTPPAQEAPKAAPACCNPFDRSLHHVEVLRRTWRTAYPDGSRLLRTDWLCSMCLLENEPIGGGSDVLHNDDTPERLHRPQLAADWVEDCLPESGR